MFCFRPDQIPIRSDEQCSFEWRKTYFPIIISSAKEGSRRTPVQTDGETEKHNFWWLLSQHDAQPSQSPCTPSAVIRSLISRLSDHLFFSEFLHTPIINDANRKHLVLTNLSNNWYVHKFSNHIYIPCISQKPSKLLRKGFPYNKCWLYIVSKERLNKC